MEDPSAREIYHGGGQPANRKRRSTNPISIHSLMSRVVEGYERLRSSDGRPCNRINEFPETGHCVYAFYEEGEPAYVGATKLPRKRIGDHQETFSHLKKSRVYSLTDRLAKEITEEESKSGKPRPSDVILLEAKSRVRSMEVRFTLVQFLPTQKILEPYTAYALGGEAKRRFNFRPSS